MDRIQHKLAMEFFRGEIKSSAKRLSHNKMALRQNQHDASTGLPGNAHSYDTSGEKPMYWVSSPIYYDKKWITGLHIVYAEIRGKSHLTEERKVNYVKDIKIARKRMEEYIAAKQVAVV